MGVLHQIHRQLSAVLFLLSRQVIRRIAFLHQDLSRIFLVAQHPVDGGGTPLCLSGDRLDAMALQMLFDLPHPIALEVQLKNLSDDLSLLGNDLKHTVRAFGISQELGVIEKRFAAPHTVADAKLDVLTVGLALRLVQCGQLVDDAVAGGQRVDAAGLDINADIHTL